MNQLAKEKLQAIKSKLILEQPFFGNLALSRVYEEDVNVPFGSMGVTGKKLIYHPDFVLELRDDQLRGVLIHEILHLALDHLTRAKKTYIPMLWNIACDYAVNLMIQDIQGVSLPPGALLEYCYSGLSAEEIYEKLLEEQEQNESEGGGSKNDPYGDGFRDFHGEVTSEEEQETKRDVVSAYECLSPQERGTLPAMLERKIKELKGGKVDWRKFLRATVTDIFQRTDFNSSRGNRNYLHRGFWFPSLTGETNRVIVVAVDTSGSIQGKILEDFLNETESLRKLADKTIVMSCDAQVHEVEELNEYVDLMKHIHFKGGGGTSFVPVFDEVIKRGLNPECLIYLTDGYGEYPSMTPNYPVVWAVSKDGISLDGVPFGIKIRLGKE